MLYKTHRSDSKRRLWVRLAAYPYTGFRVCPPPHVCYSRPLDLRGLWGCWLLPCTRIDVPCCARAVTSPPSLRAGGLRTVVCLESAASPIASDIGRGSPFSVSAPWRPSALCRLPSTPGPLKSWRSPACAGVESGGFVGVGAGVRRAYSRRQGGLPAAVARRGLLVASPV